MSNGGARLFQMLPATKRTTEPRPQPYHQKNMILVAVLNLVGWFIGRYATETSMGDIPRNDDIFSTPESDPGCWCVYFPSSSRARRLDVRSTGRRVMMRTPFLRGVRPEFQLYTIAGWTQSERSPKYSHGTRAPYGLRCMNLG